MRFVELPLLKRELIEAAQKRRTYFLRTICLAVFGLVFITYYTTLDAQALNFTHFLGWGRQMAYAQLFALLVTIYVLAPGMSCGAISSEKEKQTLGLLLISKLKPRDIILEKLFSRMMPLVSLTVVASPLLAMAYLFGGISFGEILLGIGVLLFAVFQVCAVSIFCSALLDSASAAFWGTYIILFKIYFVWSMLIAGEVLPTPNQLGNISELSLIFFPGYQLASLLDEASAFTDYFLLTVPAFCVTLVFLVGARFALVRFSFGSAFSLGKTLEQQQEAVVGQLTGKSDSNAASQEPTKDKPSAAPVIFEPLSWRERKSSVVTKPRLMIMFCLTLAALEFWMLEYTRDPYPGEFCSVLDAGVMVIALVIVLGMSCKIFAKEREQQTLDSLLATPLSNRQVLGGKIRCINMLMATLLIPILITVFFNCAYSRMRITTLTATNIAKMADYQFMNGHESIVRYPSRDWMAACTLYVIGTLGFALIFMNLVKWLAVYFGLKMKSQMKAMVGSLTAVLLICFVPLLSIVTLMLLSGNDPDDFPLFFLSTPMIPYMMNELHDFQPVFQIDAIPDSELFIILGGFFVYGTLMLAVRFFVLLRLPSLLNRADGLGPPADTYQRIPIDRDTDSSKDSPQSA